MGTIRLPDTILARLQAQGRLPASPAVASGPGRSRPRAKVAEDWPGTLAGQARMAGLPEPVREHRFHPVRRWPFDLAWVEQRVAVEVDGGAFMLRPCPKCRAMIPQGGRHTSGAGFREDCVKVSEAAALGWRVLRVLPEHITSGQALAWLERALAVV